MSAQEMATVGADEPVATLDGAWLDRLQGLGSAAMARNPDVGDRLLRKIEQAKIVATADLPSSVVTIGSEVTFRDEALGSTQTVVVVMPPEADISQRRISLVTPIGVALIGLSPDATIEWETLSGEVRRLTVLKVRGGA